MYIGRDISPYSNPLTATATAPATSQVARLERYHIINTKIRKKVKNKIVTVRKLSSKDIILITNSAKIKHHLIKKIS